MGTDSCLPVRAARAYVTAYELARHLHGKPNAWKVYMMDGRELVDCWVVKRLPDGSLVEQEDQRTGESCVVVMPEVRG